MQKHFSQLKKNTNNLEIVDRKLFTRKQFQDLIDLIRSEEL